MTVQEAKECMIEQIESMKKSGRRTNRDMEMEVTGMMIVFHKLNIISDDEHMEILEDVLDRI